MNYELAITKSTYKVFIDKKSNREPFSYEGIYKGQAIVGCIAKNRTECIENLVNKLMTEPTIEKNKKHIKKRK